MASGRDPDQGRPIRCRQRAPLDYGSVGCKALGFPHVWVGGLAMSSLVELVVPEDDEWVVIIDLEGLVGAVRATVEVVGGPTAVRASD